MKFRINFVGCVALVSSLLAIGCQSAARVESPMVQPSAATPAPTAEKPARAQSDDEFDGEKIVKTDAEWRAQLSAEQYRVLREDGTEKPYSGEYLKNKEKGTYHCAACRLKLFSSETKYESNTGWPSFYQPFIAKNVTEKPETAIGDDRIEVECSRCGSHLGHVFDDGPKPTGLRYCMNSVALTFEKAM